MASPNSTDIRGPRNNRTPTYRTWISMRRRCLSKIDKQYPDYGGRGITICERWLVFENFLMDMGERPKGKFIERNDNNGNYEPSNCRWATQVEQSKNRRNTVKLSFNGETMCLKDWARRIGIWENALQERLNRGWTLEAALLTPSLQPRKR